MKLTRKRNWMKCVVAGVLAFVLAFADVLPAAVMTAQAAEATITSMAYTEGPVITREGIGQVSFGFIMPTFNGGANTFSDVASDLGVKVKMNGNWEDIDDHRDKYTYNSNWGHWSDGGFNGYWFVLTETTEIQLYSKANHSVTLNYTLQFNTTDVSNVTSLAPTFGTNLKADRSGSAFINYPNAVSATGTYPTSASVLDIYVKPLGADAGEYVNIDNNAASGWIYDNNFGSEEYGYWFVISEMGDINVKLALKENPAVYCEYTITYEPLVRTNYKLYPQAATTVTADAKTGAAGMVFPRIGGNSDDYLPNEADLEAFVIEFYKEDTDEWVPLGDSGESGWYFQGNGYVDYSSKNQWGYFFDYVYGLWFQPITENFKMRVGYPEDGVPGGEINDNYVEFTFIGAPNAYRPEDILLENIEIDETDKTATSSNLLQLDGWTMIFNEEFEGTELNENYWTRETGYFSDPSNPDTWGWGNSELESYTDSPENSWVSDGALHLKAVKGDTNYEFDTDGDGDTDRTVTSTYQSGKIVSRDKVRFTYGRVDFRAKLPAGVGLWPATWMMPDDDVYGTWARSGEIDVMEVRGRVPNESTGAIHFGDVWPNNKFASPSKYTFPEGTGVDDGYHTYSVVWEEDYIAWYVDGTFFQYIPSSTWYTVSSPTETAPFDQHFYLIMNLALGGWFDSEVKNEQINIDSAEMLVDFVRVYQPQDEENYEISEPTDPVEIEGLALNKAEVTLTEGESVTLSPVYTPADTTEKGVTWTTTDASIATVNNGKVTAVKEGTVTITATSTKNPALKATATVTVEKAPEIALEGLSLSKTELTLTVGDSTTLKVTYNPTNTTFKDVTWKSSNEEVATVVDGKVTAVAVGETVITVTSVDNPAISASCDITVEKVIPQMPASDCGVKKNADGSLTFWVKGEANKADNVAYFRVNLNKANPALGDLGGYGLTADASDANYYTYTLAGPFADTDTVTFMFGYSPIGSGRVDSKIVTFTYSDIPDAEDNGGDGGDDEEVAITDLTMSQSSVTLTEGENTTLSVGYEPKNTTQKGVIWSTSDEKIATVANGVVTAVAEGEAVITVTSASNPAISASCTITVEAKDDGGEDPVVPSEEYGVTANADGSITLWAYSEGAPNAWCILNNPDATLNQMPGYGLVKDETKGDNYYSYTLNVNYADGDTCTYIFAYTPAGSGRIETPKTTIILTKESSGGDTEVELTALALDKTTATLKVGENTTLKVGYTPDNTTQKDVTWKSSNEAVATVDNGVVTAVAEGEAVITVTSASNPAISASCTITVEAKDDGGEDPVVPSEEYGVTANADGSITLWAYSEGAPNAWCILNNPDATLNQMPGYGLVKDETKGDNYYSYTLNVNYADGDTCTYIFAYTPAGSGRIETPKETIILKKTSGGDEEVALTALSLDKTTATMTEGENIALSVTYTPGDTTQKDVTWKSSNEAVATVDNGVVTAVGEGTATITVTSTENSAISATCTVTVKAKEIAVTGLTMSQKSATLTEGENVTLSVSYAPENTTQKGVIWSSSNEAVATVVNGVVTAVGEGTATITATSTSNGTVKATCEITVEAKKPVVVPVTGLTMSQPSATLTEGENVTLSVSYAPENTTQKGVTWSTSDAKVATVVDGKVTAVGEGSATITATSTSNGAVKATCTVTVKAKEIAVTGLTMSQKSATLTEGENITLSVGYVPENTTQKGVTWSTSDAKVATVVDGKVTAVGEGTATITATSTSNGTVKATCEITVEAKKPVVVPVTGLTMSQSSATLTEGENVTLSVSYAPANTTQTGVTWSSSNEAVAKVVDGVVTAVGEGSATITATSTSNGAVKATCSVTVKAKADEVVAITGLKLDKTTVAVTAGESTTLTVSYEPGNTTQTDVVWSTSDENIATVENGVVTAVARGTVTITVASASNADIKATCTITVLTAGNPFGDIKEKDWYYKYAKFAYDYGLMSGKGTDADGKILFDPANNMTRAEFVQMLYAKEGKPAVEFRDTFTDVKEKDWFASAVIWANQNGIVAGTGDKFDVNGKITRQEMAAILYKYAGFKGYDVSEKADITSFVDDETVSSWAVPGMQWAVQYGVVSGKAGNKLAPLDNATRAEAATMMRSFMVAYEGIEE